MQKKKPDPPPARPEFLVYLMNRLCILLVAFLTLSPFNMAGERLVTPDWMVREKLLGFPLQHPHLLSSELIHTYALTIRDGKYIYSCKTDDGRKEVEIDGFDSTDIPLYRIQNDEGKYLTVDTTTYLGRQPLTATDVTGVNLVWRARYDDIAEDSARNKAALQLFAIAGVESGPENAWYPAGEGYLYLPLASYKIQYSTGTVLQETVFYNKNIGLNDNGGGSFRVSLYSPLDEDEKYPVVAGNFNVEQITPIKFKWKKPEYVQVDSETPCLVYDVHGGFYYAGGGERQNRPKRADAFTILTHWEIDIDEKDPWLHTFSPVLAEIYGERPNDQLQGAYYFRKLDDDPAMRVQAFDLAKYAEYIVQTDTFEIIATAYESPYYDIPGYALPDQLVALESPFVDRNLTDNIYSSGPVPVGKSYLSGLNKNDISLTFLTVYKTTEVSLGETEYVIPYFAFSLTRDGKEYFLHANNTQGDDSVFWTPVTDDERDILLNPEKYRDPKYKYQLKQYKFCFPYQADTNGRLAMPASYGEPGYEIEYQPVYFQTLSDDRPDDYPYLIVAVGSSACVKRLDKVITENNPGGNSLKWNIYSVDYSLIDPYSVTSWVLAGKHSDENEWVALYDSVSGTYGTHDVQGLLTDARLFGGGVWFVGESKAAPVNYGTLADINNGQLEFISEGQAMIGSYVKHPIFYYKIKIPDKDLYLTDSRYETNPRYKYQWFDGRKYPLAYFREGKYPDYEKYLPTRADERFIQTFGFRYIDPNDAENPIKETDEQTFAIISNANFRNYGSDNYRYLADKGRLVFVDGMDETVLILRYGRKDGNGSFITGLEVVGRGEIFGVTGGVRLLNRTGKKVNLYTIDGRLIKSVEITKADQTLAAPRGVVIVKCEGKVAKVIVG